MAANVAPIFTLTPIISSARIVTANANRDGTGTLGTVATGSTEGTRIDRVTVKAEVTTTAGMIRLFVDNLTTIHFVAECIVTAITVGAATKSFEYEFVRADGLPFLVLPNTYILKAGTHNAEAFIVMAHGGNY